MPSLAVLTLLPLLVAGQAPAPDSAQPAAVAAPAGQPAPAEAAPAVAVVTPAASAIPEEMGMPPGYTFVIAKLKSTLYGFVEADGIFDTTRSFIDLAGMSNIALKNTENGDDGRLMASIRNSRIGYKLEAPAYKGFRASGQFEMDFLGNQPGTPPVNQGSTVSQAESSYWNNPTFRVRHAVLKLDNDFVTFWFGQTWELVGWQPGFQLNTVAIQGIPGELYSRTAQLRALHKFHLGPTTLEVAIAALRSPQEDSAIPDFQGGVKLTLDKWTGVQTVGSTSTGDGLIQPAQIGLSGGVRTYKLANGAGTDGETTQTGWVGAADIMIPIIPAKHRKAWALTVVGEFADGSGDADLYTSLKGGSPGIGTPPGYPGGGAAYAKVADLDPGLAGWSTASGNFQTIDWQTFILSAQFYLPPDGRVWVAGAYSNSLSDNIGSFGAATGVFFHEIWWDANLFADITPTVRFGAEYSNFTETYGNGANAQDQRVQLSAFYIF